MANDVDKEFLSRFHLKRVCQNHNSASDGSFSEVVVDEWDEYIEPLTIHARHPLGFSTCKFTSQYFSSSQRTGRSNVGGIQQNTHIFVNIITLFLI